eukprot:scaffold2549_cov343-Prasinococcus_capsulatus_cf.AAC.8
MLSDEGSTAHILRLPKPLRVEDAIRVARVISHPFHPQRQPTPPVSAVYTAAPTLATTRCRRHDGDVQSRRTPWTNAARTLREVDGVARHEVVACS